MAIRPDRPKLMVRWIDETGDNVSSWEWAVAAWAEDKDGIGYGVYFMAEKGEEQGGEGFIAEGPYEFARQFGAKADYPVTVAVVDK